MTKTQRIYAFLPVILCLFLLSGGSALTDSPEEMAAKGRASLAAYNAREAMDYFKKAVEADPASPAFLSDLAAAYRITGDYNNALSCYDRAIGLDPKSLGPYEGRWRLFLELGNCSRALEDFSRVVGFDPGSARTYQSMAWFLATTPETACRNGRRAVEFGEKALALTSEAADGNMKARLFHTLAAAYAENGDFAKASAMESQARGLYKPSGPNDTRPDTHKTLIGVYNRKQTYAQWAAAFDRNAYSHRVRDLILERVVYPPVAEQKHIEGTATVSFAMREGGKVEDLDILKTSGHSSLDRAVVQAVLTAEPLPEPPNSIRLRFPVIFKTGGSDPVLHPNKFMPSRK